MRAGWEVKTLGEVCEVVNGGTPKTNTPKYWDGDIQWITPSEMGKRQSPFVSVTNRTLTSSGLQNSSARKIPSNSVILSTRAPIGHLVINTVPMATNQGCRGLIPHANLNTKFLYYFLSCNVDLLNELGTGTTFKELSSGKLKEVRVPLPPLAEQQRIVAILDEAFEGIATARKHAEQNLQNAKALFESHLEAVFSQKGEGWVEKRLEEEVEFSAGYAFKSVNYVTEHIGIRLLRGDNIMQGVFRWEDAVFWPQDELLLFQRFTLEENDIVLAMDRPWVTAGLKIACISKQDLPCLQVQRTARLRTSNNLQWRYLFHLLRSKAFVDYLLEGQTGLGVPHISGKQILSFRFWLPPLTDQAKVVTNLDALTAETNRLCDIYTQKIAALDALKKSLLHQAFSGEL